jgi:hypothetical protein
VGLFKRRRETLNEQLLREAGLDPAATLGDTAAAAVAEPKPDPEFADGPPPPRGRDINLALYGDVRSGPTEYDACVTVSAPDLRGNRIEFTTIPDGDVIVSEETGDADLSPLADAVERHIDPPYRAAAARQDGDLWAVGANRIQVAQIPFPDGEKLELSFNGSEAELRVDGEPSDAAIPRELAELGEAVGMSYFVEAARIDGDVWEVRVTAF